MCEPVSIALAIKGAVLVAVKATAAAAATTAGKMAIGAVAMGAVGAGMTSMDANSRQRHQQAVQDRNIAHAQREAETQAQIQRGRVSEAAGREGRNLAANAFANRRAGLQQQGQMQAAMATSGATGGNAYMIDAARIFGEQSAEFNDVMGALGQNEMNSRVDVFRARDATIVGADASRTIFQPASTFGAIGRGMVTGALNAGTSYLAGNPGAINRRGNP